MRDRSDEGTKSVFNICIQSIKKFSKSHNFLNIFTYNYIIVIFFSFEKTAFKYIEQMF